MTNLEIEAGPRLATRITDTGDGFPLSDRIAPLLEQGLVVAVECQVTVSMIDDDELSKAPEPVGKDDTSGKDGLYGSTATTRDHDPMPTRTETRAPSTKVGHDTPGDGPWQDPFLPLERGRRPRKRAGRRLEFSQEPLQSFLRPPRLGKAPLLVCDPLIETGQQPPAFLALPPPTRLFHAPALEQVLYLIRRLGESLLEPGQAFPRLTRAHEFLSEPRLEVGVVVHEALLGYPLRPGHHDAERAPLTTQQETRLELPPELLALVVETTGQDSPTNTKPLHLVALQRETPFEFSPRAIDLGETPLDALEAFTEPVVFPTIDGDRPLEPCDTSFDLVETLPRRRRLVGMGRQYKTAGDEQPCRPERTGGPAPVRT